MQRTEVRAESVSHTRPVGPDADDVAPATMLRLAGKPASLAAAFKALSGGRPRASRIAETYYDTDDGRLRRRGYTLRLRETGGRYTLTLTRADGTAWTAGLAEPAADMGALPPDAPRGAIGTILPEELRPRLTGTIDRRRKRLALTGAAVAATLDTGHIAAGARREPVAALRLDLLTGSPAVLYEEARRLLGRYRLTVGGRPRAMRGMALLDDAPPAPVKAVKPVLTPGDSIDGAMATIVATTAAQIAGNLDAAADGRDPEGVHQLRVALRRLRSAFALFRDRLAPGVSPLDDAVRRALASLGAARDLDVFLLETLPPVLDRDRDNPGLRKLAAIAASRRRDAYDDVRRLVRDRGFNRLLVDLRMAAEPGGLVAAGGGEALGPVAAAQLHRRHRKALKAGKRFERLSYAQRHEVRIALKKLRYACDYFQTLFPGRPTRAYLKRMAGLQDDLGRLNDATVAEDLVDRLAAGDAEAATGAALVKGWYRHRLLAVEPRMLADWRRFADAKPFWRTSDG